jgi:hypothetical protein
MTINLEAYNNPTGLQFIEWFLTQRSPKLSAIRWIKNQILSFCTPRIDNFAIYLKGILQLIKENPELTNSKLFLQISKLESFLNPLYQKIEFIENIKNVNEYDYRAVVSIGQIYKIVKEIEVLLVTQALEDHTPLNSFSSSFNDWDSKEDEIWDNY